MSAALAPESARFRLLLAPQEFKGSLTAREATEAMATGAQRILNGRAIDLLPLSDGGPGLVDALVAAAHGRTCTVSATDPLGRPVAAAFGLLDDGRTAVVELAAASGLSLLSEAELDPLQATTYGTGQVVKAALDSGADEIVIGIGGSATNDGGAGLAAALGVRFLDRKGQPLPPGGAALARLARIDTSGLDRRLSEVRTIAACDVRNPLIGPDGASAVYGPQKGASPAIVEQLDDALRHYAEILTRDTGMDVALAPGAGAAGGAGAALLAFLRAELRPGFSVVAEATNLEQRVAQADLVITGEGSLDRQTLFGKAVAGLAGVAARHAVPVIALAGVLGDGYETLRDVGLCAAFSIVPGPVALEESRLRASDWVAARTEAVLRTILAGATIAQPRGP